MNKYLNKPNKVPAQGMSPREAGMVGKVVGKSKRQHFKSRVVDSFILAFSTVAILVLAFLDKHLLAGTMGAAIWDEFGEDGLAIYIPFVIVMIAAFAHRLISKQSDEELKRSWLGRLVKRLCILLLLSVAVLFSTTMLENLHPSLPASSGADDGWGQGSGIAQSFIETKAAELAETVSPFAETIFALVSGGILIITAFLLMILMDWWWNALKNLIVGRAQHKAVMQSNEYLKGLRKRYISVAHTVNSESVKTHTDREMEFALYFVTQGLKALSAQRKQLSDRKLKERIEHPNWQEMGEDTPVNKPEDELKQRREFERALDIETTINIITRTQS